MTRSRALAHLARKVLDISLTIFNSGLHAFGHPRTTGVVCLISATLLGLGYMAAAGAPMRYLGINASALVVGLLVLAMVTRGTDVGPQRAGVRVAAVAGVLLATSLLGEQIDGVTRWVKLGGLSLQPSIMLLPVSVIAFAGSRNALATMGMIIAAGALAIQPDRALAGMLVTGLAALAITRRDWHVVAALGGSIAGFAGTLARADRLPAAPYVEQILYSSFDVHPLAGAAVLTGSMLLIVPAIVGWRRDAESRDSYLVFGAIWLAVVVAAALGNYPTPVVGYGSSAIIGYALCLITLPRQAKAAARATIQPLRGRARLTSQAMPDEDRPRDHPCSLPIIDLH